jgi:hypothetical protein
LVGVLFVPSPEYQSHQNVSFFLPVPLVVSCLVWVYPYGLFLLSYEKYTFCGQTKLQSAATIAQSGVPVIIVKCESTSAEQALRGGGGTASGLIDVGTIFTATTVVKSTK